MPTILLLSRIFAIPALRIPALWPEPASMLQIHQVKKSFGEPGGGRLSILDIERFTLAPGEQVLIRGRSGCGKTTLLHVISGITSVDSGKILVDEVDIAQLPEAGRDLFRSRNIGYVFQTFNLMSGFTALENVMLGMTFTSQKKDPDWARHLLDRVGLADRMTHKPGQLSVGQQQRVAVARALANRPRLLLADEPTASIDTHHQQQVIDLIRETCTEQKVSLILVTHADEIADQFERIEALEEINRAAQIKS